MKKRKRTFFCWGYKAEEAIYRAVAEAIDEHRRNGVPIVEAGIGNRRVFPWGRKSFLSGEGMRT